MSGPFSQNNVTFVANRAAFRSMAGAGASPLVYMQGTTTLNDGGQSFYALGAFGQVDDGVLIINTADNYCYNQVTVPEPPAGVITVPEGGTGLATLTSGAFLTGNGAGNVNFTIPGTGVADWIATPSSANLRTAVTDETGTGSLVFATSPTLVTPLLGTPTSGVLTNCTGYPASGLSGLGAGIATWLATPSSTNLAAAVTDETGTGSLVFATSPTFVTPLLGTPTSGVLTNCTGYPVGGLANLGAGIATFLTTPSSANLAAAVTDETGTGALVMGTAPTLNQPNIVGTTTNNNATAGSVGEYISSTVLSGAAVNLANNTSTNITSIALTAGDWDVCGNVVFAAAAGTTSTLQIASISQTSATTPTLPNGGGTNQLNIAFTAAGTQSLPTGTARISLAAPATVYLVAFASIAVSTMGGFGFIGARRMR